MVVGEEGSLELKALGPLFRPLVGLGVPPGFEPLVGLEVPPGFEPLAGLGVSPAFELSAGLGVLSGLGALCTVFGVRRSPSGCRSWELTSKLTAGFGGAGTSPFELDKPRL